MAANLTRREKRRALLKSAAATALLLFRRPAEAKALGYPRSMEGPMIGAPGPNHFTVWVRASGEFEVQLEWSRRADFSEPVVADRAPAVAANDYIVTLRASRLEPATAYYYRLRFDGAIDRHQPLPHRTRTMAAGNADFTVAFGSCCRIQYDDRQRIFDVVRQLDPDLFLWLGDNVYADSDQPEVHADLYRRGRVVPSLAPLLRSVPQLAIWDDHDFGYNDSDARSPVRDAILRVFKRYWANPSYGEPDNPGVYFKHSHGAVDFFLLDGRYYRDPSDGPEVPGRTMLGPRQKQWLKEQLAASRATFKVLVSGTGWSAAERHADGDSWAVYSAERDEILDFIRDRGIGGVFGISGDSHMGELNCIPRSEAGGYDFYDFCSSPLVQVPAVRFINQMPEVRVRPVWNRTTNVGLLTFRTSGRPSVEMRLFNDAGESVWAPLRLAPEDLVNGVRTWDRLSDRGELRRLERHRQGRGYYGLDPR
jgi:alkaline phosphatase D